MTSHCCALGRLTDAPRRSGSLVTLSEHFTVNAFQGDSTRPRFVLQIQRHVTSYADLTDAERRELGRALSLLSQVVEREPGVERVYSLSFNETEPGHLHWHLLPRFVDEPGPYGPALADLVEPRTDFDVERVLSALRAVDTSDVAAGRLEALAHGSAAVASDANLLVAPPDSRRRRRTVLDSPLTDAARRALEVWNRRVSAYRPFRKLAHRRRDSGELYVVANLVLLFVMLAAVCVVPLPSFLVVAISVIAVYRAVDIAAYALTIVLMTRRSHLRSVARSILLFTLNLLELTLIAAILLASVNGSANAALWAFGIGEPSMLTLWSALILRLQSLASFAVMGLALASVLSKVSESFDDDSASRHDWIRNR